MRQGSIRSGDKTKLGQLPVGRQWGHHKKAWDYPSTCNFVKRRAHAKPNVAPMHPTGQRLRSRSVCLGATTAPSPSGEADRNTCLRIIQTPSSFLHLLCVCAGIAPAEPGRVRVRGGPFTQLCIIWRTPLKSEHTGHMPFQTQFLFQACPAAPPVGYLSDSFTLHLLRLH